MKTRQAIRGILGAAGLAAGLLGAGSAHAGTVTIKGSDTMVVMGQR